MQAILQTTVAADQVGTIYRPLAAFLASLLMYFFTPTNMLSIVVIKSGVAWQDSGARNLYPLAGVCQQDGYTGDMYMV